MKLTTHLNTQYILAMTSTLNGKTSWKQTSTKLQQNYTTMMKGQEDSVGKWRKVEGDGFSSSNFKKLNSKCRFLDSINFLN